MKKTILLLVAFMFLGIVIKAQVNKTIECTAGNLSTLLTTTEINTVTNLVVTGTMDARDFKTLRTMSVSNALRVLDLTAVTVDAYTGTEGTADYWNAVFYPENEIPEDAFYKSKLTSISLPNSVTSIGNSAFSYCDALTSITIPNSVTTIGNSAFYNCDALTSITIPNSVTSIGKSAFSYCDALTSITIPNSVTSIGERAFSGCENLASITIPSSVTTIGGGAFSECFFLTSILVDADNMYYSSLDGVLFNKTKTELIQYPNGRTGAYTIPNSVTSIGYGSFASCGGLTSLTIPNSVTSIGNSAFYNCDFSGTLTIPNSVTSIGNSAFFDCDFQSVTILSTNLMIGERAFASYESVNTEEALSVIKVYTAPENLIAAVDAFGTNSTLTTSGTLYVPQGMKGAYELSAGWNTIANIAEYSTTPTLSTSVRITIPANANNSISMDIASNSNWTASSTAGWLTVNPASGYGNGSVSVTAAQNSTSSPRTATISVSGNKLSPQNLIITQELGTSGMKEVENPYISIFPNPADLVLHISGFEDDATVKIYDLNGKTVISQSLLGGEINISNLQNGVYNIQISDINGVFSDKFLKN